MNRVELIGRLTRDPDVRYTQESLCVARYSLAVDRPTKAGKEREADFINCLAFGKTGEFVDKYLHKGMKIGVCGRIQTGSYTNKEGRKVYTTEVLVSEHYFCERAEAGSRPESHTPSTDTDGFMYVPDDVDDDELPFN